MRFAVFVFSLLLVFVPTYSYAFIPALAMRGLIAKTAKGAYKKLPSKKDLAIWTAGAVGTNSFIKFCKSNKKCKEIMDEIGDFIEDWDEENPNACQSYTTVYGERSLKTYPSLDSAIMPEINYLIDEHNRIYGYKMSYVSHNTDIINASKKQFDAIVNQLKTQSTKSTSYVMAVNGQFIAKYTWNHGATEDRIRSLNFKLQAKIICNGEYDNDIDKAEHEAYKQEITQNQVTKIVNNLSETEINTIINNYGDQIDIDKYCQESGSCDELSKEFGDEVTKNQNKYDIDKINKANCMVEKGVIVSCDNAKLDIDEEETEEGDTKEEGDSSDKEEDEPIDCKASEFHQKICDFIDWYQDDDFEPPEDDKIEAKDLSEDLKLDKDRINFNGQCPPDKQFTMSATGHTVASSISYRPLCDFFIGLKPFLIGVSGIISVLIITGVRRG